MTTYRKKLIEVALPLDAINTAAAHEKSIRHGHPSTLHLWWARRPLAAARAVLFAQLVDDPSAWPERFPTDLDQERERQRLFAIIEELVRWENTGNEKVLRRARDEILASWARTCADNTDDSVAARLFDPRTLPGFHDPFAGGGALPLEAQRLGLESLASDLNPVAVLINKAMIEIPPKFAGRPPVNPEHERSLLAAETLGTRGLAKDVEYYGRWMRREAERRIGDLYAEVEVTVDLARERPDLTPLVGSKLAVVAWLWARTVKSPNPAFADVEVPLTSTFMLSAKGGDQAYVEPVIENRGYRFAVRVGKPKDEARVKNGTRAGKAQDFLCLMSGAPVERSYIRDEGRAGRLGARLMAVVATTGKRRIYLSPTTEAEALATRAGENALVDEARATFLSGSTPTRAMITGGVCSAYGLSTWGQLFTDRQVVALTTFADLVKEARAVAQRDARAAGMADDGTPLALGGTGATAYADAIAIFLALSTDRLADRNSSLCGWDLAQAARGREATVRNVFARQALPMVWDFVEVNILGDGAGSYDSALRAVVSVVERLQSAVPARVEQADAASQRMSAGKIVSTDPPYFDNISYAELSDFFYGWLRRALGDVLPALFRTVAAPKVEELVAAPHRQGSKAEAEAFFLSGMTRAMRQLAESAHPAFPITIYYAFKQSETERTGHTASTGWESFLDAVIRAGLALTGTWPVRTELSNRMIGSGTNALASSIVLVCRPRSESASSTTRGDLRRELRAELPRALRALQHAHIAPVDVAQAAIGPGMAVFSQHARVVEADGSAMTVRAALQLVNEVLDEYLTESEGEFDADTRWAITWFEQRGYEEGPYGDAETLAKARNVAVSGIAHAGIIKSAAGKVRLLRREELRPLDYDPAKDERPTVWEYTQHLIRNLEHDGEEAAARLLKMLGAHAETARALAYRLYNACERRKWAEEARAYNGLVIAWPELEKIAAGGTAEKKQTTLDLDEDD